MVHEDKAAEKKTVIPEKCHVARNNPPSVSVVIPSYNHEQYIAETIESVLGSSLEDHEIVVVDDGSNDRSVQVVEGIEDVRVKLFRQKNMGAHHAINRGVETASAPWVAILNSDDRFHPKKLEHHLELHRNNPDLDASASRVHYISESGALYSKSSYFVRRYERIKRRSLNYDTLFASLLVANHLLTTSCLFIRRNMFLEMGGFLPLRYVHDWFMFLALAAGNRFVVLEEALVDYRRHRTNTIGENDLKGMVEENFVLEWALHRISSGDAPIPDPKEATEILALNTRVCYRLMLLFKLWREQNGNDLERATAFFAGENHSLMDYALGIARKEQGAIETAGKFLKRSLAKTWWKLSHGVQRGRELLRSRAR